MADEKTPSPRGSSAPEQDKQPESLEEIKLRGRPIRTWALGIGAVGLAISAAFGGLQKAPAEVPDVQPGTAIAAGQFEVTVDRVVAVKDLDPVFKPDPGGALLVVVAKIKVTDDRGDFPDSSLLQLVDVPGIPAGERPLGIANMRDNTTNPMLQPEQPEQVIYVWKLPKATEVPSEVKLEVEKTTLEKESKLTHNRIWLTEGVAGKLTVKVKNNLKARR
ncbi:hypothetical protein [Kribbella deserti]|uniref:DUF4352 domain-containing protein n=1 Tax=Kribbella deserti TaxID=1926257 RepID=A0ABV6QX55_9ACTN